MHLIARLLNPASGGEHRRHQLRSWLPIRQLLQLSIPGHRSPPPAPARAQHRGEARRGLRRRPLLPPARRGGRAGCARAPGPTDGVPTVTWPTWCPCPKERPPEPPTVQRPVEPLPEASFAGPTASLPGSRWGCKWPSLDSTVEGVTGPSRLGVGGLNGRGRRC